MQTVDDHDEISDLYDRLLDDLDEVGNDEEPEPASPCDSPDYVTHEDRFDPPQEPERFARHALAVDGESR